MPGEIPSYLRLVKPEKEITNHSEQNFDWRGEPHTLADITVIVSELERQLRKPGTIDTTNFTEALNRIQAVVRDDEIGITIEENPVVVSYRILVTIFETLQNLTQAANTQETAALVEPLHETTTVIFERLIEIAARGGRNELSAPNPAFRYILQTYTHDEELRRVIEEQIHQPISRMRHAADWQTRAKEQEYVEEIGRKLQSAHTTLEVLARLPLHIEPHQTIYLNPSLQVRRKITGNAIINDILSEVRQQGADALERFGELRQLGYEPTEISTRNLLQFGNYNCLNVILPEIQREKVRWQQLEKQNQGRVKLNQCDSWFKLVWFINTMLNDAGNEPQDIRFSVIDPETGAETIQRLTLAQVRDCVEQAPCDPNLLHQLPSRANVRTLKPKDAFLLELRDRLAGVLG